MQGGSTATAIGLALLTALGYGCANYLGPVVSRRHPLGGVLLAGQLAALSVAAGVVAVGGGGGLPGRGLALALGAGVANGVALAALYRAGQVGELSVIAPVSASAAAVPVLYALVAGEHPGPLRLAGIPLALAGIVAVSRRSPATGPRGDDGRAATSGLGWAALAALALGAFLTLFARASAYGTTAAVLWSRVSLVASTVAVVVLRRVPRALPWRAVPAAALPGLLLVAGTLAFGAAAGQGPLSVISVVSSLNTVVTVALAVVLLGERLGPVQRVGVVAALTGVVVMAVG